MALSTFSKFYYGSEVEIGFNKIDINEGSGELSGTLTLGVYSLTGLATELQQELNAIGNNTYTVSINRDSRIITISSSGTFSLLISTGTNSDSGVYDLLGFTGVSDLTGSTSYSGDTAIGSEYITQFFPQDYVAPGFRKEKGEASVNVSATGDVEVISFGDIQFIEMDLLFITDIAMDGVIIRNNPTGVQDALDFLTFAIKRGPIEFMPNKDDTATFYQCILESTATDGNATKFTLREETGKNLPGIYRTGKLEFRIVE